jgi:NAD+ synthase (glutamine-hydrolysing)
VLRAGRIVYDAPSAAAARRRETWASPKRNKPMKLVRVAAAAVNQTPLDWERNAKNLRTAIAAAKRDGASVLCLPELCITGYGCEDAFLAPETARTAFAVLESLLPETRGMVVSFGLPVSLNKAFFNACCLVADGELRGFVAKQALAGDGLHYEPRWFKPWPRGERTSLEIGGRSYPIGDVHFDVGGVKIGFEICEDAWVAERPGLGLALDAVDLILNPSASHFAFGKHEVRRRLVQEASRAFGVSYVYANLVGNEAGRAIYDGDALIATGGEVVAESPRLVLSSMQLVAHTVDVELTRSRHARLSSHTPTVAPEAGERVKVPVTLPEGRLETRKSRGAAPWESSAHVKEEEFARAVALGLLDYMEKTRSRGFVVSLSGGADSSAVACLVRLMVRFGVTELGFDGLLDRLSYAFGADRPVDEAALMKRLLTTAYQSTQNSGEVTRRAARELAATLGASHFELDVEGLVQSYVSLAEGALGRKLDWQRDDTALQNIQARVRAPSVWMLANVQGALLLSTSNRSEAAVGYATMDGDTAGGLSPIGGIDKAFLRKWLRWLETSGPAELGPLPVLRLVNEQIPTAELRPPGEAQTDEGDLMPYDLLDVVERAAIRDKYGPLGVYRLVSQRFPQYSPEQCVTWLERFFRLFARNQWKRERYAPSFHVDDANLDPKTWCRFPILSGGFERELGELRAEVLGKIGTGSAK